MTIDASNLLRLPWRNGLPLIQAPRALQQPLLAENLVDTSAAEYDEMADTNIRSTFLFTRYAVPHMLKQGSGTVLMISSMPPEEATVRSLGLGANDFIPKPFRTKELLARVKAQLLARDRLDEARREARNRSAMMDIMTEVTASLKPDEIYQILVRRVAQALNISRCSIIITGPEDDAGTVVAAYENPGLHNLPIDLRRYPEIRHCLATGEVVHARDVCTDPLYTEVRDAWEAEGRPVPTRSAICVRFSLREHPAGVFFLRTMPDAPALTDQDLAFAEQVIRSAVAALEKAYDLEHAVLGQEQMRQLAETDPLTAVYNRRALMQKMEQEMDRAARYATRLTAMMIDIDNFKSINDTGGHAAGEAQRVPHGDHKAPYPQVVHVAVDGRLRDRPVGPDDRQLSGVAGIRGKSKRRIRVAEQEFLQFGPHLPFQKILVSAQHVNRLRFAVVGLFEKRKCVHGNLK